MAAYWAGIDLGTSDIKTVLMDAAQTIVAEAHAQLSVSRPAPFWSEQDPEDWWQAVLATFDDLARTHPEKLERLQGIGLAGQMHGATLLGADDEVLRPAMLWNDGRAEAQCTELEARADFRGIGGNIVMAGFTAPKLEWVRQHEPETFEKTRKILLPKDYVRLRLTGEYLSDMSDSAGTLWLDVAARDWSDALLAATGLTRLAMPALVEGTQPAGNLRRDLALRWGIAGAIPVAGGGGDNAASAAGVGAVRPGTGFLSLGTSGVLFVANDGYSPNTEGAVHAFCHAVPDTWHQMGVILSATDALNWLSGISGKRADELAARAADAAPDHDVLFLPYLSGERTPHNNPGAHGSFTGLSHGADIGVLARAVMEGVACAFADCRQVLAAAGTQAGDIYALGGGARSQFWLQTIANVTGLTLLVPENGDFGAAFGAARLGFCASENADPADILSPPKVQHVVEPRDDGGRMAEIHGRYRALYPKLHAPA